MEPGKKISFGFSKQKIKPSLLRQPSPPKIELVECLEEQSIKVKDAVEEVHEPLIIPIKEDRKGIVDRIKQARAKHTENGIAKSQESEDKLDSEPTLDEQAARELLNDARKRLEQTNDPGGGRVLVLPSKEEKLALEGEPEPTLEDYENIPISDYGLAMLRGMGWKEGMGIGKKAVKTALVKPPDIRPKGLGLGATRAIQDATSKEKVVDKDGKQLILVKGASAKIIAGPNEGNYCKVLGLDEEASRVIVKTALKGTTLSLNEFMLVPVDEEEYTKNSKVLNHAKYKQYKEKINNDLVKKEPNSVSDDFGNQTSSNQTKDSTSRSHSSYAETSCQSMEQEESKTYNKWKSRHNINEMTSIEHSPSSDKGQRLNHGNRKSVKQSEYIEMQKYYSHDSSSSQNDKSRRSRRDSSNSSSDSRRGSKRHADDERPSHSVKSKRKEKFRNDSSSDGESKTKKKYHKKKDKRSHKDRSRSPKRKHSEKKSDHRRTSSDYEYRTTKSKK